MANKVIKDFYFSLAWIEGSKDAPHYYEVVLTLKETVDSPICKYLAFSFNSFDTMYVYLRSLAKYYKLHSVDALKHGIFSTKIQYTEIFNAPDIFEKMIIKEDTVWPSDNCHGYFKLDSF